jgi:putative FmdB family regulatory protein
MPIYEFYCNDCNTIFNFFSYRIDTEKLPLCPKCNKKHLDRLISKVSFLKGAKEQADNPLPDIDEGKLRKAMSLLEKEAADLREDDPRQAAQVMRKLIDSTGLHLGTTMEEALKRLENGEDPDRIEKEMGDILDEEKLFDTPLKNSKRTRKEPPLQDETLYFL